MFPRLFSSVESVSVASGDFWNLRLSGEFSCRSVLGWRPREPDQYSKVVSLPHSLSSASTFTKKMGETCVVRVPECDPGNHLVSTSHPLTPVAGVLGIPPAMFRYDGVIHPRQFPQGQRAPTRYNRGSTCQFTHMLLTGETVQL